MAYVMNTLLKHRLKLAALALGLIAAPAMLGYLYATHEPVSNRTLGPGSVILAQSGPRGTTSFPDSIGDKSSGGGATQLPAVMDADCIKCDGARTFYTDQDLLNDASAAQITVLGLLEPQGIGLPSFGDYGYGGSYTIPEYPLLAVSGPNTSFPCPCTSQPPLYYFPIITPNPVGAIPEPASWIYMLLGFMATGSIIRRRPTATRP